MLANETLRRLEEVFRTQGVRLAVLFGSRAAGNARADSDVDIAILGSPAELEAELALASQLSEIVQSEVDLIALESATPLLGHEVARKGIPIYEREAGAFAAFRAGAVSVWLDFDELTGKHRAAWLKRVAEQRT